MIQPDNAWLIPAAIFGPILALGLIVVGYYLMDNIKKHDDWE